MRTAPFGAGILLVFLAAGCPKKRELPEDPPDMVRIDGAKLSVPRPEGYEQVSEGSERIQGIVERGGVTMVKRQRGDDATSIAVDVGETPLRTMNRRTCDELAEEVGKRLDDEVGEPELVELPTGDTCHFTTEEDGKKKQEFFYVAGKPPLIVACHGRGSRLAKDCKHVASWIRQ